jgi:hypothetical protein
MSTKIEGQLERNDGGAAATLGEHLVELFYSRIIEQGGENPTQLTVLGTASTRSRAGGAFEFLLADGDDPVGEKVRFVVSALSGKPVADVTLDIHTIREPPVVLKVAVVDPTELVTPDEPVQPPVVHVNGQLIDPDGKPVPCGMQVTVVARPAQSGGVDGAGEPRPIMAARADRLGAFFGDVANDEYAEAAAIVSGAKEPIPVALQDGRMPSRLLLAADFPDAPAQGVVVDDCGCHDVPPRNATQADIAYAPDTYSADLGACGCPQFNTPNRAIEEFDYYTVVRTTQPDVRTLTLADADRTPQPTTNGDGNGNGETTRPVIAASYDVQLNVRELADPGRIRITLVTADGKRRVVSETGSTNVVAIPPGVMVGTAIEAAEEFLLQSAAVRSESFAVTANTGATTAVNLDLRSVRNVEVEWISPAAPAPWGLTGVGITATSTDGASVQILIEGEELYTADPWFHVFVPATTRQLWTGTASLAAPSVLRLARFAAAANPDPLPSDHVPTQPIYRDPSEMVQLLPLGRSRLDAGNAVDWDSTPTVYEAATVASGHLLHFKQVWYADGYSLGDLLYSLPLAPGQKKLISVVDWERRERTERTEFTRAREGVEGSLTRDRDLGEVVTGTLTESVRGGSRNTTAGVGAGTGGAGNGTYQGMNFGALLGVSGGYGESNSDAWQVSGRALATSSMQTLRDKTLQSASAVRSLRSSVVQTVSQGESTRVTTEVVANHNHCHALTVQYFEVLRHLKVTHELADVQECLFVPLPIMAFDRAKVLRWRQALEAYLHRPELATAFDAVRRVETNWSEVDYPVRRYADEKVTSISGELELTLLIPLPPLPEKPKPRPEETADQVANAVKNATNPTTGFLGVLTAIATGGASLLVNASVSAAQDVTKATIEGARALGDDLLAQPTPEEKYAKFQREVMPGVVAGFVDQLELHALVGGASVRLGSADFTLVSDYRPGIPLLASVKATLPPSISRADIQQLIIKSRNGLPPGCRAIVNTATLRYRTRLFEHPLVDDRQANDDIDLPVVQVSFPDLLDSIKVTEVAPGNGAAVATPLDAWEQRNPRTDDRALAAELLDHLNEQLEYYHHAIWWTMDPNRRYMLLDGYVAPGPDQRSIASVVENRLIGIVGNSLVLPVAYGVHLDPRVEVKDPTKPGDLRSLYPAEAVHPARVSLPTRGVFAEAVMGACNACETIDDSKLWRWEESPIDEPPSIEPASTATRRTEPASVTPTAFPTPIVSIEAAPAAPDPVGVAAALQALGQQSFADITGLAGTQANAAAAYGKALDTALAFGKEASTLAQQAGTLHGGLEQSMEAIDKADREGKIDPADAKALRVALLKNRAGIPQTTEESKTEAAAAKKVEEIEPASVDKVEVSEPSGAKTVVQARPRPRTVAVTLTARNSDDSIFAGQFSLELIHAATNRPFYLGLETTEGFARGAIQGLPAGPYSITGRVLRLRPPAQGLASGDVALLGGGSVNLSVPFELDITKPQWFIPTGNFNLAAGAAVVQLLAVPTTKEFTKETTISLAAGLTTAEELRADAKVKLEPKLAILSIGEVEAGGGFTIGSTQELRAGQDTKFTITYRSITGIKIATLP